MTSNGLGLTEAKTFCGCGAEILARTENSSMCPKGHVFVSGRGYVASLSEAELSELRAQIYARKHGIEF